MSLTLLVVQDASCIGPGQLKAWLLKKVIRSTIWLSACFHVLVPQLIDRVHERVDFFFNMYDRYQCDGIILDPLQFCNYWGAEAYICAVEAEKRGIPLLRLTHEIYGGGAGQLKTRVEAFTEQILNAPKKAQA